ncbi:MAG: LiaF transmembrane domain-containing protein [Chloroflexota bacterium]
MSERHYGEKEEKEEKEEKTEEKSWDEKWRRDPLSAVVWAGILIWAGVVLLAQNLGLFDRWESVSAWSFIFIGAGLIVLGEAIVRFVMPQFRRSILGTAIFGIVLLGIGLGNLVNWGILWAIILIVLGLSLLFRGFFNRPGAGPTA